MTSRAEAPTPCWALSLISLVFFAIPGVPLAFAASGGAFSATDSMILDLGHDDMLELGQGIEDLLGQAPITGRYDQHISEPLSFATVGIDGVSYSFDLEGLSLDPDQGRIHAQVQVKDLNVTIERLSFNDSGSMYCTNVPITSSTNFIPVTFDVVPSVTDRRTALAVEQIQIALASDNFQVGQPAECHTVWGFNWLVRRILPLTARIVRSRIADGVEQAISTLVDQLSERNAEVLQISFTWPFKIDPVPAFYATIHVWPSDVEVTPEHFRFGLGADVSFDPDPVVQTPHEEENLSLYRRLFSDAQPSYLGVARSFLEQLVGAANQQGLFDLTLDRKSLPQGADLMDAAHLSQVLPDAATRFAPDTPVAWTFSKAQTITVATADSGEDGVPTLEVHLGGLGLQLMVGGKPYYEMTTDAVLRFGFGFNHERGELGLTFESFASQVKDSHFAPELTPQPADTRFDNERFTELVQVMSSRLRGDDGRLLTLALPNIHVGRRTLELLGSSVRDDFVTLDARVQ